MIDSYITARIIQSSGAETEEEEVEEEEEKEQEEEDCRTKEPEEGEDNQCVIC